MKDTTIKGLIILICITILAVTHKMVYEKGLEHGKESVFVEERDELRELGSNYEAQKMEFPEEVKAAIEEKAIDTAKAEPFSIIIDNMDSNFYNEGAWVVGEAHGYQYGENYLANRGTTSKAFWETQVPAPGTYKVYISWTAHPTRNSRAIYRVNNKEILVNQRDQPREWYLLGEFEFEDIAKIELEGSNVCADAVAITNQ